MAFTWELVRRNGDIITLLGYKPNSAAISRNHNAVTHESTLNYTLSSDDAQSTLRCIVRVDEKYQGSYETMAEECIPAYSTCYNEAPENWVMWDTNLNICSMDRYRYFLSKWCCLLFIENADLKYTMAFSCDVICICGRFLLCLYMDLWYIFRSVEYASKLPTVPSDYTCLYDHTYIQTER